MKVLCVGTLLLDIITEPMNPAPEWGGGVGIPIEIQPGGNAFNVAVDLVQLGVPPSQVCCMGAVGDDPVGRLFIDALEERGVTTRISQMPGERTGKSIILQVEGADRTFIVDKGASAAVSANSLLDVIREWRPDVFCIGEIGALESINLRLEEVLGAAKAAGCITVVDYVIIDKHDSDSLFASAKLIDVFHCNEYEASILTGKSAMMEAASEFARRGFRLAFVSQGKDTLYCAQENKIESHIPFKVESKDNTGAGDAFVAGFIANHIRQERPFSLDHLPQDTLNEGIRYAMAAGAAAVTAVGCTDGVTPDNIRWILSAGA